jgi:UPF0271 protein
MSDSESSRGGGLSSGRRSIDLNADLGEGCPNDQLLLERVSSASICCGAHAGDPDAIRVTLRAAVARGVTVGAHPGYPDRQGFGRRPRVVSANQVEQLILEQVETLHRLASEAGCVVRFLKPHGALYNQAQHEEAVARGVVEAASRLSLPLLGQPDTPLALLARDRGIPIVFEGFPDRRIRPDGSLVPRSEPDAVLQDPREIEDQVIRLVAEDLVATLCIHGDEPAAVANADLVRGVLRTRGIEIQSFLN